MTHNAHTANLRQTEESLHNTLRLQRSLEETDGRTALLEEAGFHLARAHNYLRIVRDITRDLEESEHALLLELHPPTAQASLAAP